MRLVDVDKLRKDLLDLPNCPNGYSDTYDKAMIIAVIDDQPTVDAIPIEFIKEWKANHTMPFTERNSVIVHLLDAFEWKKHKEKENEKISARG